MTSSIITSSFADVLNIKHPILLAGMAVVSSPELAAAVSNAGGLGVIGAGFPNPSPKQLRGMIAELHQRLDDPTNFGVDLLIPQVGGTARKTNYDYTKGLLPEMIDVICESKCRLFVCAVGVPPKWMVDKLHSAGVLVMNMVGSPKHVNKALAAGVDAICAQGYEAGGHTGDIATMVLVPKVVSLCQNHTSPLTGGKIHVVAAGGIYNGSTFAAALTLGADAVWVGTRFVASKEAKTTKLHQKYLLAATTDQTMRSVVVTGRPARLYKTEYLKNWETTRSAELKTLTDQGIIPLVHDMDQARKNDTPFSVASNGGYSFSQSAGDIDDILPAAVIVEQLVNDCARILKEGGARIGTNTARAATTTSVTTTAAGAKSYRLWHSPGARSSRVLWTMHELGIEHDIDLVTMPFPPRVTYKPYLKHNVLGTIPFFESLLPNESHVKMTESVSICMYLAQKYNSTLTVQPHELEYATFLNWMVHSEATLTFPQTVVLRYTKQEVGVADAAATGYAKWYIARLRLLNNALADGRQFLCMSRFTVADICVSYALFLGTGLTEPKSGKLLSSFYKPHTKKWMEAMLSRSGWTSAAHMEIASLKKFKSRRRQGKL